MTEWLTLLLGLWIGAGLGWAISVARTRARVNSILREQEVRTAAAEARVEEVRSQLASAKEDFETLREDLRQAETARAAAAPELLRLKRILLNKKLSWKRQRRGYPTPSNRWRPKRWPAITRGSSSSPRRSSRR